MKTITFDYVDVKGNTSERVLMVTQKPSDKYSGVDLSELEPHKAAKYVAKYEELQDAFLQEVTALNEEFDLKFRFRQFFQDKMANVIEL